MKGKLNYTFSAELWQYLGKGGWYFVSLPTDIALEIRNNLKWQEEGWGRMKAIAEIGGSQWKTAIWFDKKRETYLLPLKAEIRKKENLQKGEMLDVIIWL